MNFSELLKASKGLPVDDTIAALWGKKIYDANEWQITTLTGSLPLVYESRMEHILKNYALRGSVSGSGTDTGNLLQDTYRQGTLTNLVYSYRCVTKIQIPIIQGHTYVVSLHKSGYKFKAYLLNQTGDTEWSNGSVLSTTDGRIVYESDYTTQTLSKEITEADAISMIIVIGLSSDAQIPASTVNQLLTVIDTASSTAPSIFVPYGYKIPLTDTSGVTENEFPFAEKQTITWGNGTITSDGKGNFSISGNIAGDSDAISLTVPYTIPMSIESGGDYCFYIGNSGIASGLSIVFYDANNNVIENWLFNSLWRKSTAYSNMAGKTIAKIGFRYSSSATVNVNASPMFSKNANLTSYIPHRYTSNYDLFIGATQLGEEECLDFGEQKIYKRTEQLWTDENKLSDYMLRLTPAQGRDILSYDGYFVTDYVYLKPGRYTLSHTTATLGEYIRGNIYDLNYTFKANVVNAVQREASQQYQFTITENCYFRNSEKDGTSSTLYGSIPTDPPVSLPAILTYQGENTLSSTETLGEAEITGRIKSII